MLLIFTDPGQLGDDCSSGLPTCGMGLICYSPNSTCVSSKFNLTYLTFYDKNK